MHAWTLRYWADGKQRERSFKDEVRQGRTIYGSGRKLAQDAAASDRAAPTSARTGHTLSRSTAAARSRAWPTTGMGCKHDRTDLRVYQQATRDGRETAPLKKRKRGEYRDIPVPTWLWDMVKGFAEGPLTPGNGDREFQLYGTVYDRFMNAAEKAEIPPGFTPHSLRHAFASAMLSKGVPITDVAHWLGYRDVRVTYRIYGHLVPSAAARAIAVLDEEYAEWSKPAKD